MAGLDLSSLKWQEDVSFHERLRLIADITPALALLEDWLPSGIFPIIPLDGGARCWRLTAFPSNKQLAWTLNHCPGAEIAPGVNYSADTPLEVTFSTNRRRRALIHLRIEGQFDLLSHCIILSLFAGGQRILRDYDLGISAPGAGPLTFRGYRHATATHEAVDAGKCIQVRDLLDLAEQKFFLKGRDPA